MAIVRMSPATAQALGLAWGFGWRVAAGLLLGWFVDGWLGTEPIFLAVLGLGAFVSGIYDFIKVSERRVAERRSEAENARKDAS